MAAPNYARVSEGFKIFRDCLLIFVVDEMKKAYGYVGWWDQGIAKHFRREELDELKKLFDERDNKLTVLPIQAVQFHDMLGVNHMLNVINGNWKPVFEPVLKDRETVVSWLREIMRARNQWAHPGLGDIEDADAFRFLDTCARVALLFDAQCGKTLQGLRDRKARDVEPPVQDEQRGGDIRHEVRVIFHRIVQGSNNPKFDLEDTNLTHTHFAPLSWDQFIPKRGTRSSQRILSYLIENRPRYLRLFLEICPGDQSTRTQIYSAAKSCPILTPPKRLAPEWCRIHRRDILSDSDYSRLNLNQIQRHIEHDFTAFCNTTHNEIDRFVQRLKIS